MELHKHMENTGDIIMETVEMFPSFKLQFHLEERLQEVGLTLTELSHLTGIRYASLLALKNGKVRTSLNLQHIITVMIALRLDSIDQLVSVTIEDEAEREKYKNDSIAYRENGLPEPELERMKKNAAILEAKHK